MITHFVMDICSFILTMIFSKIALENFIIKNKNTSASKVFKINFTYLFGLTIKDTLHVMCSRVSELLKSRSPGQDQNRKQAHIRMDSKLTFLLEVHSNTPIFPYDKCGTYKTLHHL